MTPTEQDEELREKLAAIEHQRWADWQRWCNKVLRENNPSPEQGDILERWDRQIETPYEKLSEREKASDMEQVDRYWQLIIADRKRVALEARIDEMKLHRHEWELFGDRPPYKGESVSLPILLAYHDDRIAELKAKQEEV